MSYETYVSSGFCHTPPQSDRRYGVAELVLYNPTTTPAQATITAYFERRVPYVLPPVEVKPETNNSLSFPEAAPAVFTDCGFWGAKIESNVPLAANILSGYKNMLGQALFTGGSTSFNGTALDRVWQFPDGLWLEWIKFYNGDRAMAPFPFNELEHYIVLNPHPDDLEVEFILQYQRRVHETQRVLLRGERMWVWENLGKVDYNANYTVKVVSPKPVTASAVRYIYGLNGLDEWGVQVHCAMFGVPGEVA
jgi:hypothetical protein